MRGMEEPLLTSLECRVLAVLVEKAITTPEYYPLTLRAVVAGCNQKSNREPVMAADDEAVERALDDLRYGKHLVHTVREAGARVIKYRHDLHARFQLGEGETAVLCELMLRGPQTTGELRTRASRMHELPDTDAVQDILRELSDWGEGPLVCRLSPGPGRHAVRYAHTLCGTPEDRPADEAPAAPPAGTMGADSIRDEIEALRADLATLRADFDAFRAQFDA